MASKPAPFGLRLAPSLDKLITEGAQRTRHLKGSIVTALADEPRRCLLLPGIAFRRVDWERRPWVIGTGLDVWEIVRAYQDFDSVDRVLRATDLTERRLRLALAFYERFPEEIDGAVVERCRAPGALPESFPTIDTLPIPV